MKSVIGLFILLLVFVFAEYIILAFQIIIYIPLLIRDSIKDRKTKNKRFPFYGCHFYVGKQGSGKTMSLVHRLEEIHNKYPDIPIYTNFGYKNQTSSLQSISDLCNPYYFSDSGCIFAVDEIQNEFSCLDSKNVPVEILGAITQQRKHKCMILVTSQVFTRVAKPLREQAFTVTECKTLLGRITINKTYDGQEYNDLVDKTVVYRGKSMSHLIYSIFYQNNKLRELYDSFAIIKRLGVKHEKNNLFDS